MILLIKEIEQFQIKLSGNTLIITNDYSNNVLFFYDKIRLEIKSDHKKNVNFRKGYPFFNYWNLAKIFELFSMPLFSLETLNSYFE